MAASLGAIAVVLLGAISATWLTFLQTDPTQEFGELWNLVIVLDVINTVIVLYYLWRIWFREPTT